MLSIEEILDIGVVLLPEQIDFFNHPENRLAVAVYGIPDPDRLYIAGPSDQDTLYQLAVDGQPANDNGRVACVVPLLIMGDDQEQLQAADEDYYGENDSDVPMVYAWPAGPDFMETWNYEEAPVMVACWDLWPISAEDAEHWAGAASKCYNNSKIPLMYEYLEVIQGSDYYGEEVEDLRSQAAAAMNKIYRLQTEYEGREDQDQLLIEFSHEHARLRDLAQAKIDAYIEALEFELMYPGTDVIDAQMPPVDLPNEQAAIWRSLQSLSWRNWSTLEKEGPTGPDALYGSRFVQANRRLCPWY